MFNPGLSALVPSRVSYALGAAALLCVCSAASALAQPTIQLGATVRDFQLRSTPGGHPDFEWFISGLTAGMVAPTLPVDRVPTYVGTNNLGAVTSAATFDQWYRDVPGVNLSIPLTLTLTQVGGLYRYQNNSFFPADGLGFGNQGFAHNYGFTMAVPAAFRYQAGGNQVLTYAGDDDLWLFVNGQLAVDLGGVHGAASRTINMDALAGPLGLVSGQNAELDIFFAERHTSNSTILIETSFEVVPAPSGACALCLSAFVVCRRRNRRESRI